MRNADVIKALYAIAKKGVIENHQERELLKTAAKRIAEQDIEIQRLGTALTEATQTKIQME